MASSTAPLSSTSDGVTPPTITVEIPPAILAILSLGSFSRLHYLVV
jgi:hypothetical protein